MYDLEKFSFWRLIIVVELIARKHISDAKIAKDTNSTTTTGKHTGKHTRTERRKGTRKAAREKKLAEQSRHRRSRLALANLWVSLSLSLSWLLYPGLLHNNTYKIIGSVGLDP